MAERLQKILANTGLGSRRELESWIADGHVRVNGREAKLGDRAAKNDDLVVKGRFYRVVADDRQTRRVIAYHKPLGEVTTRDDPENRRTVFDRLPRLHHGRWISVGRLDINTLGLLLLTNDGELANALMHPSSEVEREYAVRVNGRVSPAVLEKLGEGVELDDGPARFNRIKPDDHGEGANQWFRVTLKEGRNRMVRRLWESQELQVSRLIRTRYGPIALPRWLTRGKVHELSDNDVELLAKTAGLPTKPSDKLRIILETAWRNDVTNTSSELVECGLVDIYEQLLQEKQRYLWHKNTCTGCDSSIRTRSTRFTLVRSIKASCMGSSCSRSWYSTLTPLSSWILRKRS